MWVTHALGFFTFYSVGGIWDAVQPVPGQGGEYQGDQQEGGRGPEHRGGDAGHTQCQEHQEVLPDHVKHPPVGLISENKYVAHCFIQSYSQLNRNRNVEREREESPGSVIIVLVVRAIKLLSEYSQSNCELKIVSNFSLQRCISFIY